MELKDLKWLLPLVVTSGLTLYLWGLLGLVILVIFAIALLVIIFKMAEENIWFTSVPQNAAVAIMWGSGTKRRLQRFAVVLKTDIFTLDAAENRIEPYWFEKKFNIWWMGPLGSVYEYETYDVAETREEVEASGQESVGETRKVVKVTRNYINIKKEEVLPLLIPPVPCAENFDVILDIVVYYTINSAEDALKALFNVGNLFKAMSNKIEVVIRAKAGDKTFDDLRKEKENIKEETWKKLEDDGVLEDIHTKWGPEINDIGIRDITAEDEAAEKLKSIAYAEKDAEALRRKGAGEKDYDVVRGEGEKSRTKAQYEGLAEGYAKVAKIAKGAGIDMEKLRTLQKMPNAKIISMPDFTGALSTATGKSTRTLAADLIAAGFTLEQFKEEFLKAKQVEEETAEETPREKTGQVKKETLKKKNEKKK